MNAVCAASHGSDTSGPATGACEAAEGWLGRGRWRRFAGGTRLLRENMAEAEPTLPLPTGRGGGEKQGKRCSGPHSSLSRLWLPRQDKFARKGKVRAPCPRPPLLGTVGLRRRRGHGGGSNSRLTCRCREEKSSCRPDLDGDGGSGLSWEPQPRLVRLS